MLQDEEPVEFIFPSFLSEASPTHLTSAREELNRTEHKLTVSKKKIPKAESNTEARYQAPWQGLK